MDHQVKRKKGPSSAQPVMEREELTKEMQDRAKLRNKTRGEVHPEQGQVSTDQLRWMQGV